MRASRSHGGLREHFLVRIIFQDWKESQSRKMKKLLFVEFVVVAAGHCGPWPLHWPGPQVLAAGQVPASSVQPLGSNKMRLASRGMRGGVGDGRGRRWTL